MVKQKSKLRYVTPREPIHLKLKNNPELGLWVNPNDTLIYLGLRIVDVKCGMGLLPIKATYLRYFQLDDDVLVLESKHRYWDDLFRE